VLSSDGNCGHWPCGRIVGDYPAKSYPEPQTRYNTLSLSKMDSVPFSKVDRAAA